MRNAPACRRRQLRWSGSDCESGPSTPGVERSVAGARDVRSVAEVGEEHPLRSRRRASKGVRGLRSSVRRRLESSDGGGLHRSTRIGAGMAKARSDTPASMSLHHGRKAVGPGRWKASRVVSLSRPKPARTAGGSGRAVRQSHPAQVRGRTPPAREGDPASAPPSDRRRQRSRIVGSGSLSRRAQRVCSQREEDHWSS
jgi:hypothetical protein